MNLKKLFFPLFVFMLLWCESLGQESSFELPVQLIGFPFIIAAVRITNFVKKLSYALNPATYRSRTRRQLTMESKVEEMFLADEAEKEIIGEFGSRTCIYERVCAEYANKASMQPENSLDWSDVISQYKLYPEKTKEFYLLSVFLGDIVRSPQLCHQLGKKRSCEPPEEDINKLI